MVSVEEASSIILSHLFSPSIEQISLQEAVGRVLGETIYADRDLPSYDRVTMDGIGVVFEQLERGQREFAIESIQPAGTPRKRMEDKTKCIEVMTGAILPDGVDTVIRYEDVEIKDGIARVAEGDFRKNQNIHFRGLDVREGEKVLLPGVVLSPAEISLLASVGKSFVTVKKMLRLAVISTGDELVDVNMVPEPHQIRKSNSYAIQAAASSFSTTTLYHFQDSEQEMEKGLEGILSNFDAIILSGGVSKGKFDFVPKVLERLGVKKLFHQVRQRPGKPFWFGVSLEGKTVFALPGNPVSTFLCFYKYVRPWLMKSGGAEPGNFSALLAEDFTFSPNLTYFLQAKIKVEEGRLMAYPIPGGGSGDFANLSEVDGFVELPAEQSRFKKGEPYSFIGFR